MINLSADIRNLSSSLGHAELELCLSEMIIIIEDRLDVYVEYINGDNSYWVPTPDFELEECDVPFGIIELGDDQSVFLKIVSLSHEVGHCIFRKDGTFQSIDCTLFRESAAWYLGYHFMLECGYSINMEEYNKEVTYAIDLYRRSENARNVKQ